MAANRRFLVSAMVCATVIAGLAGCSKDSDSKAAGSDDKKATPSAPATPKDPFAGLTADQIADKALDTTKAVNSLKAKGSYTDEDGLTNLDLAISQSGDCQGTMSNQGAGAELRQIGQVMYMKGDDKFWELTLKEDGSSAEETDAVVELFKGRWIKLPAEDAEADDMGKLCDTDELFAPATKAKTGLTKGADDKVDGKSVVTLTKKDKDTTTTLYVATEGEPYLLKVTVVGGKEPGSAVFSDFDTPITVTAPPADQVTDPSKLG